MNLIYPLLIVVAQLALLIVVMASVNAKLGRIAKALENRNYLTRLQTGALIDELTRKAGKVQRRAGSQN